MRQELLLIAPSDTTPSEVIRRHLNRDLIAGQNADEVHTQLAGDGSDYLVTVLERYLEHGVWVCVGNKTCYLDYILF